MRHIRITLEDEEAALIDTIRSENDCTYKDLLMLSVQNKKEVQQDANNKF